MIFSRKSSPVSKSQSLESRPLRLVSVQVRPEATGGGRITVPLQQSGPARWLLRLPPEASKTFEFDALGLFVWECCDGKTTVQQVIRRLAKRYNLTLREAEVSTVMFLQMLTKKGLIGMNLSPR